MINIDSQLQELSLASASLQASTRSSSGDGEKKCDVFHYRNRRSHPGAGLYRAMDDARLVLQVV